MSYNVEAMGDQNGMIGQECFVGDQKGAKIIKLHCTAIKIILTSHRSNIRLTILIS